MNLGGLPEEKERREEMNRNDEQVETQCCYCCTTNMRK